MIEKIFDMYSKGYGYSQIADALNDEFVFIIFVCQPKEYLEFEKEITAAKAREILEKGDIVVISGGAKILNTNEYQKICNKVNIMIL